MGARVDRGRFCRLMSEPKLNGALKYNGSVWHDMRQPMERYIATRRTTRTSRRTSGGRVGRVPPCAGCRAPLLNSTLGRDEGMPKIMLGHTSPVDQGHNVLEAINEFALRRAPTCWCCR